MTFVIDAAEEVQRSDDQLMEAVMNRESEALECIYMRYESLLRTVLLGVIRDESEVDDILHDVLLQVWDLGDKYKPGRRGLRGLLVTLARRRALDPLRRRVADRRATLTSEANAVIPGLTGRSDSVANKLKFRRALEA